MRDISPRGGDGARQKSKKWSPKEVEQLMMAISDAECDIKDINWADVATHVMTRTAKQCREKYKNDLRPELSKEPWSSQEEYILARAHCQIGNQWADIARFLPCRSENTIKNKWNATLRSKADAKAHTLLWTYAQTWHAQGKLTSLEVFQMAVDEFCRDNGQHMLQAMEVPESYFDNAGQRQRIGGATGGPTSAGAPAAGSSLARAGQLRGVPVQPPARKPNPRHSNRKRVRSSYNSDEEDGYEAWSDSDDNNNVRARARTASKRQPLPKRSGTALIQQQLLRQRQQQEQGQQQQEQQQQEQEQLELRRLPPPFPLPAVLPPSETLYQAPAAAFPAAQPPQPPQPPQPQPAGFGLSLPALSDITNLTHMEPSATIKLCVPKHTQGLHKGFSFLSDQYAPSPLALYAHGAAATQPGDATQQQQGLQHPLLPGQQQGAPASSQAHLQQQLQQQQPAGVLPTPTPGAKLHAHNPHVSSPVLGAGRGTGWGGAHNPWLSPAMLHELDCLSFRRELAGLEGAHECNPSPATLLKLLSSVRRDSMCGIGGGGGFGGLGGSACKALPLFGGPSRRDSLLLLTGGGGGSTRRDSLLLPTGGRKESLGGTGVGCTAGIRPSWLSRHSGSLSDLQQPQLPAPDLPATQPQPPMADVAPTQPQPQTPLQQQTQQAQPQLVDVVPLAFNQRLDLAQQPAQQTQQQGLQLLPPPQPCPPLPQQQAQQLLRPGQEMCVGGEGKKANSRSACARAAEAGPYPRLDVGSPTCGFVSGCLL